MRKIKLCIATSGLSNQGPPNVIYNILKYMDYGIFDVYLVTLAPEKSISRISDFRELPIHIYQIAPDGLKNALSLGIAFYRILKKLEPDIVHVHCPRSILLSFLIPKTCKKMVTIHNFPELSQIIYGRYKGRIIKHLRMMMTRQIENRVACSESIAEIYNNKGIKTISIPNGCSLPIWSYNQNEKDDIKRRLGLDARKKWFLFIGGFVEGKNPGLVIEAFENFNNDNYGVVLLGDGYLYPLLKKRENDRVLLPGFKNNVYDYVKACDYYISLSESEGLPNALLECMSAGLPSVLSNIPGHREVLRKSKFPVGYIAEDYSINSVIDAIGKVVILNTEDVRGVIQDIYICNYTAKLMSEKYQDYYLKVASDS